MQIIEKREFLSVTKIMGKYERKFILVGFLRGETAKGCPICFCDTAKEVEYYYKHLEKFPKSLRVNDFYDFLILPGTMAEGEVVIG